MFLYVIITMVWIIPALGTHGQNYVEDFKKIKQSFSNMSFNMKYRFYPYDSANVIADSMVGYCSVEGKYFYYRIKTTSGECEYVRNDKYYFIVDHSEKAIALKRSTSTIKQMWNVSQIDSVLNTQSANVVYKDRGEKGQYNIAYAHSSWNRVKIIFDKRNYRLDEICMYSTSKGKMFGQEFNKPIVRIYYSDYKQSASGKDLFAETKYFHSDKNGAIVLSDEYRQYKLLNHLKN